MCWLWFVCGSSVARDSVGNTKMITLLAASVADTELMKIKA